MMEKQAAGFFRPDHDPPLRSPAVLSACIHYTA
jgi:hypothetical protein